VRFAPRTAQFVYIFFRGHLNPRTIANGATHQPCQLCGEAADTAEGTSTQHLVQDCPIMAAVMLRRQLLEDLNEVEEDDARYMLQ
jgi:hypothetical protein